MMTEEWRDVLGDGLAVTLELPIAATRRPITANDSAAHLLDAIAVLEDGPQLHGKDESPPQELQRLELKIDLLTDLVSSLLADRVPAGAKVTIGTNGVVVPQGLLPAECDRVEIYPCHWMAQPVVLELGPLGCRGDHCGARWFSPEPGLKDAIGRWVFRLHRREIARLRNQAGAARSDGA